MILNGDRNVMLSMLELITVSPKPADVPSSFEYDLVILYLKYSTLLSK